jgi:hypothetical protein
VCKSHYIDGLIKELGIDNSLGNPTYTPTTLTKKEILDNHRSVLNNIVRGLVGGDNNIFVMEERRVFSNISNM